MTTSVLPRPAAGLRLLLEMNRDRILYSALIVLALWGGTALGTYLIN